MTFLMQRAYKLMRILNGGAAVNPSARSLVIGLHGGGGNHSGGQGGGGGGQGGIRSSGWSNGWGGNGRGGAAWGVVSAVAALTAFPSAADASSGKKADDKHKVFAVDQPVLTVDSVVDLGWKLMGPLLTNLGFSGVCGYCCGFALKRVGQAVAVLVGLAFVSLQYLALNGLVTVNWSKMEELVKKNLDINADGKLDEMDFKLLSTKGLTLLSQGVPSVGGFLTGFVLALRF